MQIIDYFRADRQAHWLNRIGQCEWSAAHFLASLLKTETFHEKLGRGTLFLLAEGDALKCAAY